MCLVAQYVCTQCSTALTGSLLGGVITCYIMHMYTHVVTTVEPPLSGPPLSGISIIRHGNSLKKKGGGDSLKMGVSAAVTMDTCIFIFCACADAHIHCCLSIKWVDQGVVYPI